MLLLDLNGLDLLLLLFAAHLPLERTVGLFGLRLLADGLDGGGRGEQIRHFLLEIQVFVAADGLVVFNSLSVELNQVLDEVLGRAVAQLVLDLAVQQLPCEFLR